MESSVHGDLCRVAAHTLSEALEPGLQGKLALLVVYAERVGHARLTHALPGGYSGLVLRLSDIGKSAEIAPVIQTGVEQHYRDALVHGFLDQGPQSVRVRQRRGYRVGSGGD